MSELGEMDAWWRQAPVGRAAVGLGSVLMLCSAMTRAVPSATVSGVVVNTALVIRLAT